MFRRYFRSTNSNVIGSYFGKRSRNVHTFSKEIIKPSIPTPHHLKIYNLSAMDRMQFRNYMPKVLFFPGSSENADEKAWRLKRSLSESLTAYYPFAGRLVKSRSYVDCNDEGIEFQESKLECTLSEYLEKYEKDLSLDSVFPPNSIWGTFDNDSSPMIVRVSHYRCGGIALAVCLSHLIGDAVTLSNFIQYWAALTRQSGDQISPHFVYSPSNNDDFVESPFLPTDSSLVRKRFVFKNTELANLKAKIHSSDGKNPTRVEFIAALFYKCGIAVEKTKTGSFRQSLLLLPVNMRSKMIPQLPKTTVGNWIWGPNIKTKSESELEWNTLIDQIKKERKNLDGMKELNGSEIFADVAEAVTNNYKMYTCSSLCNMDLDKVNFGWGKTSQFVLGDARYNDSVSLSDTSDGEGIEALVNFQEQEMVKIQVEKELHELASLN